MKCWNCHYYQGHSAFRCHGSRVHSARCCHEDKDHKARRLQRRLYNDRLVNMMGPPEIAGLSKHMAMKAALHAPQRF